MAAVACLTHMTPAHHVLTAPETNNNHCLPAPEYLRLSQCDRELDISLENLNQLFLQLDPTFEVIQWQKTTCPDKTAFSPALVSKSCPANGSPDSVTAVSPCSLLVPSASSLKSGSRSRSPIPRQDGGSSGSLCRLPQSNRNSAVSLLSTSSCSDTSYILGSTLSLTSEGAQSPESNILLTPESLIGHTSDTSLSSETKHLLHPNEVHSCPASLSGSPIDIPVLLINGVPQHEIHSCPPSPGLQVDFSAPKPPSPHSPHCYGKKTSMKFVMDTSKQWFRPQVSKAEAEFMVKNKKPGTFVIRDSTSYKGSFALAVKVDRSPKFTATADSGDNSSDSVRHFLIESSAKGVRVKGSCLEPYFESLPALVYQHTISAYSLPCKLLLSSPELVATEEKKSAAKDKKKTAISNFVYLNAVPTEMLTGPCAVQKAVTLTFEKAPGSFTPAIVNMKVSQKGIILTDINRKLFTRRYYPAHLLSYSGEDPDNRRWMKGSNFGAKMFGFVAKGVEAGMENVCHLFAEYDPLQPCHDIVDFIQETIPKI